MADVAGMPLVPHMTLATHGQLVNIEAQTDTMINGLKQSVSKDGGHEGTPTLLVRARQPTRPRPHIYLHIRII